jgi:hypothetical protein
MPRRELDKASNLDHPLNKLQKSVLGMATSLVANKASPGKAHTVSTAIDAIRQAVTRAGFCKS